MRVNTEEYGLSKMEVDLLSGIPSKVREQD